MNGWMDDYRHSDPLPVPPLKKAEPVPAPLPAPAPVHVASRGVPLWAEGQSRATVIVICCPNCGDRDVQCEGNPHREQRYDYWCCKKCSTRWKELKDLTRIRVWTCS